MTGLTHPPSDFRGPTRLPERRAWKPFLALGTSLVVVGIRWWTDTRPGTTKTERHDVALTTVAVRRPRHTGTTETILRYRAIVVVLAGMLLTGPTPAVAAPRGGPA